MVLVVVFTTTRTTLNSSDWLIDWLIDWLLLLRRKEQSGFTPGRSTIDRIITLTTLVRARREHRQSLWIACVDLKAAFDSVDQAALWPLLLSIGLPHQIVDFTKELYTDTVNAVRVGGMLSDWFRTDSFLVDAEIRGSFITLLMLSDIAMRNAFPVMAGDIKALCLQAR